MKHQLKMHNNLQKNRNSMNRNIYFIISFFCFSLSTGSLFGMEKRQNYFDNQQPTSSQNYFYNFDNNNFDVKDDEPSSFLSYLTSSPWFFRVFRGSVAIAVTGTLVCLYKLLQPQPETPEEEFAPKDQNFETEE